MVSGISTDVALFSKHGAQLVHHYRVSGDCAAYASLRGSYKIDLLYFTNRACVDAYWAAKRSRNSGTGSLRRQINRFRCLEMLSNVHRTTILRFAKSPIVSDESSQAGTSAVISVKYDAPQVPHMCLVSFGWRRPILPVLLPLPSFATQSVVPDIGQSSSVATQKYPSSPVSRSSTP